MAELDLVIITNSPGELSSWVRATVEKLRERAPEARIIVMLVPCPYASGGEERIARSFRQVDLVLPPRDFIRCLLGLPIAGYKPNPQGLVVFLGGDYWHAKTIAWRLRYPAVAYAPTSYRWARHFVQTCVPDEPSASRLRQWGLRPEQVRVIGNLVAEAARPTMTRDEASRTWGMDALALTVGIMPGSRFGHARVSLPVFLKVAEELQERLPRIQFLLGQSPFLTDVELARCLTPMGDGGIAGVHSELTGSPEARIIRTSGGVSVRVIKGMQYDLMNRSDLLLAIPGTNTAEGGSLGIPMIVCMTWKAPIPRGGLGVITNLLPMYSQLRRSLLQAMLKRMRFTALPNIMAGRKIVPEICVEESSTEITEVAASLLQNQDERRRMGEELKDLLGGKGAAERMADAIVQAAEVYQHGGSRQASRLEANARMGL